MITTFFQDIKIKCDSNENYYANGSLSNSVLERYYQYNDEFIIFSRKELVNDEITKKFDKLEHSKLKFNSIKKLSLSIFIGKDNKKIKDAVKKSDRVIVRMPSFIGIPAIIEAKKQNKKCLIEMVGCPFDALWYHGGIIFKLLAIPTAIINKKLIKKNEYVTYVSKCFLQKRYPCKNKTYSISDVDILNNDKNLIERTKKLEKFSKNNIIKIGTIASSLDVKYKGQQYVIKAISLLKKKGYKFEYLVVGGGNNTYLLNLAKKYKVDNEVKFIGTFPHSEVEKYMKNLDIYIQPSNAESFGRVIIEAMNTACPVVGSSAGGIPENVQNEYVFKKRKYKDLAKKIELIINSNLKEVAADNYKIAEKYNKESLEKRRKEMFEEFYSGVI